MRLSWSTLRTWEDFIAGATTLHDFDGYPARSVLPTPKAVGCIAPTIRCVELGVAFESGGKWCCTAGENFNPYEEE